MATLAPPPPPPPSTSAEPARTHVRNGREFLRSLGDVPIERVLFDPPPGTVTGEFYEKIDGRVHGALVELVDGTLVEKPMGMNESRIASVLIIHVGGHVLQHRLGFVAGEAGTVKMSGGNCRMPDVAVYLRSDYPGGKRPTQKVPQIPPRLAVEVLSEDNTAAEIDKKLAEFFASGCRLAYVIDPKTRTARRYTSTADSTAIDPDGTLDGGDVVPGFAVSLASLFDEE